MKNLILFFGLMFSINVFACECNNWGKQFDSYSSSELVADVTVTKVYPILKGKYSDKYFKIDIKYNEVFKGNPVKTIFVAGHLFEGKKMYGSWTSCSLGAKVGQRLIIFENKDNEGNWVLHYCSPKIYSENKKFAESKSILKFIKEKNLSTNYKYHYFDFGFDKKTGKDDFETVKGLNVKNSFAAFEITLNSNGTIKNIETLQDFGSEKDEEIFKIIKNARVIITPNSKISDGERFTLIMYYYPKQKGSSSFISQNFL